MDETLRSVLDKINTIMQNLEILNVIEESLEVGLDNVHSTTAAATRGLMSKDAWIGEELELKKCRRAEQVLLDVIKSFKVLKEEVQINEVLQANFGFFEQKL